MQKDAVDGTWEARSHFLGSTYETSGPILYVGLVIVFFKTFNDQCRLQEHKEARLCFSRILCGFKHNQVFVKETCPFFPMEMFTYNFMYGIFIVFLNVLETEVMGRLLQ